MTLELETESSCTCVSFDLQGKPNDPACICRRIPIPPPNPVLAFSTARKVLTLRMPSRIRPLLAEFLELLLCVIQPLSGISGCISPASVQSQMQQHATQASHLRSLFDADLIEQEIRHGVFDPSGLFRTIGDVLKSHCAPMRDRAVEAMVEVAQSCAPGGNGSSSDAVRAVRMCLDILELMKLVSIVSSCSQGNVLNACRISQTINFKLYDHSLSRLQANLSSKPSNDGRVILYSSLNNGFRQLIDTWKLLIPSPILPFPLPPYPTIR